MTTIDELQAKYDRQVRIRARWVDRYDAAPDGSHEKQVAIQQLDEVGKIISRIEKEISDLLDETGS